MTKRIILAALVACLVPAPALAQAPSPAPVAAKDDLVRVRIETTAGPIVVALDRGRAPLTVANFLAYVEGRKYDGETFYRAMPYGDGGLIQGGIRSDGRKLRKPVAHEPVAKTGLKHVAGALSMANAGPGTAQSDFFVLTTDIPALDADFAAFGRVVEGMDVVKKILAAPVSPTKGEGNMKGQMLEPGVKIVKATRLAD